MLARLQPALSGACLLLVTLGAACPQALSTPAPPVDPRAPELAAAPPSRVALGIDLDFTEMLAGVEELVPRSVAPTSEWQNVGDGAQVRFTVSRGPIALAFDGDRLVAQTEVEYAIRARKAMLVILYFQCGCAGESWCGGATEARRRMTLRAETRLVWSPEWHLAAQTSVPAPRPANECVLGGGFWSRNMTPLIAGEVQRRLGEVAQRELDTRVPLLTSIQSRVARAFAALHEPMPLREDLWIVLSPSAIEVSPVDGRGAIASATVSFATEPRVVRGARPDLRRAPLPPLALGTPADGFRVAVRSRLPFSAARRQLRESLVGHRFPASGGPGLEVTAADVYGSGEDVVLRVDVTGAGEGPLYLTGRATYDEAAEAIVLTDLAFTSETLDALRVIPEWTGHDALLAAAADAARFSARDLLSHTRVRTARELTRELAPDIALSVDFDTQHVTAVGTDRHGFALALVLEGRAELTLIN